MPVISRKNERVTYAENGCEGEEKAPDRTVDNPSVHLIVKSIDSSCDVL